MTRLAILLRSALLILTLVCVSQTMARSQKYKVTIKAKEQRLLDVFKTIQKQTNLIVFYSNTILNDQEKVSIQVKDEALEKVLDQIVAGKALQYEVQEKYIVISPKEIKKGSSEKKSEAGGEEKELMPPDITVKGRVTNENGEPIPGASVLIKGTKRGTSADWSGSFTLTNVPDNATLVVSGTNIETVEMRVQGRTELSIVTKMKVSELEEVIVGKGYYEEKQRFTVGNAVRVTSKELEKQPVQNLLLALQGRVPGLFVEQSSGINGAAVSIRIQGQNSIRSGNEPLLVIDGTPYFNNDDINPLIASDNPIVRSGTNPWNHLNINDVETVDILKDADATAIYGSRAANGAIIVTTKKGKAGQPTRISFNAQQGWGKVPRRIEMLNQRQYLDMRYEAYRNDGIDWTQLNPLNYGSAATDLLVWDTTRNTDWQESLIGGTAQYSMIDVSVSGGSANLRYLFSTSLRKTTDVFPGDFDNKIASFHYSISSASLNQKFRIQFSGNYSYSNNKLPGIDLTETALKMEPIAPALYKGDTLNWELNANGVETWSNPLLYTLANYSNNTKNLFTNLSLSYTLVPGLEIKNNIGYTQYLTNAVRPTPLYSIRPSQRPIRNRESTFYDNDGQRIIIEPQLTYSRKAGKFSLNALVGGTIQSEKSTSVGIVASGYSSDLLLNSFSGGVSLTGLRRIQQYKYSALFGRIGLIWDEKYMFNLTARRDGSSRFGDLNKFSNFWSVGVGWIFSEEKFFSKIEALSMGKLRASYGITGNDQIGNYTYLSSYTGVSSAILFQNSSAASFSDGGNPYLEWEQTKKWQLGMDLGFFKDRVHLGFTYSLNSSSNQLISYQTPTFTGFSSVYQNFPAKVQNTSIEAILGVALFKKKDFVWNVNFNLTIPHNKVTKFPGIENTSYASATSGVVVGQPLGILNLYGASGVDPMTGIYVGSNYLGQPVTPRNPNTDRVHFISLLPRFYWGVQNSFQYKGLSLDLFFQAVRRMGDISSSYYYNGTASPGNFSVGQSNQPLGVLERWQKPGDQTPIARFSNGNALASSAGFNSTSLYSYDVSYIRLSNAALSWEAPKSLIRDIKFHSLKFLIKGQNLFTITKFKGLDPQTGNSLPPLRVITVGIQCTF